MTAETNKMTEDQPDVLTGEVVKRDSLGRPQNHRGRASLMPPHVQLALKREIAVGTPHAELGRKYGYTRQGIGKFAERHALEIDDIREHLDNEFAGMPIAIKKNRIAAYQDMYERLSSHAHADHHEWVKAQAIILRNVAEEKGELPPRQTMMIVPVQHVYEGVDLEGV